MSSFSCRTRIKICGLTQENDVHAAVRSGADAIGFVLYEHSPRFVSPYRAAELARLLPPFVTPILLLVNADQSTIEFAVQQVPQAVLQFHGEETPAQCLASGRPYIKVARMTAELDLVDYCQRFASAQAILLDAYVDGYGGAGKVFDWSWIPASLPLPLVLSGGLTADNVAPGIARIRPWAVDVSSGVEQAKGIKDHTKIAQFCMAVRAADAHTESSGL